MWDRVRVPLVVFSKTDRLAGVCCAKQDYVSVSEPQIGVRGHELGEGEDYEIVVASVHKDIRHELRLPDAEVPQSWRRLRCSCRARGRDCC